MDRRRILYLPVETKARELPGKAFLAARAAQRGWYVIMGPGPEVRAHMEERPAGVFVVASVPVAKAARLQGMRSAGHHVCNLCEESIVYPSAQEYCARKLSPESLAWVSRLLVVGQANAEHVRTHRPEHAEKIAVTGNPRFDTLLPELRSYYESEARRLRQSYGRFVVVNTNFSFVNPFDPDTDVITQFMRGAPDPDGSRRAYYHGLVAFKARQMKGLQDAVQTLANTKLFDRVVIRPHPVENHDTWRDWATMPNVEVRYEGTANVWMLAAEAVLHAGCTTGIEGLLLDRPVFSYVPEPEQDGEFLNQSDRFSQQVSSADHLIERLRDLPRTGAGDRRQNGREDLSRLIANAAPPYAADLIMDQLDQFDLPEVDLRDAGIPVNRMAEVGQKAREWWRGPAQQRPATSRQKQKFPGIDRADLHGPLSHWTQTRVLDGVPRLSRLSGRLWACH